MGGWAAHTLLGLLPPGALFCALPRRRRGRWLRPEVGDGGGNSREPRCLHSSLLFSSQLLATVGARRPKA